MLIPRISAQQTVAPDAVTRVFPSVGGYKEFAPTIKLHRHESPPALSSLHPPTTSAP
jgi:hypothetical protein